jgi:transcriptional regulator with XRE-family HTH domain
MTNRGANESPTQAFSRRWRAYAEAVGGDSPTEEFGDRLRDLRTRRGFTQDRLAAEVGATGRTVQRWEAGDSVPYPVLDRLADVLGVTRSELLPERDRDLADRVTALEAKLEGTTRVLERVLREVDGGLLLSDESDGVPILGLPREVVKLFATRFSADEDLEVRRVAETLGRYLERTQGND